MLGSPLRHYRLPASLSIPYGDIDAEHQALIDLLNQAFDALSAADAHSRILSILADLNRSLAAHFRHEEQEMEKLGYPDLLAHSAHHLNCLRRLDDFCDAVAAGERPADGALLGDLFDLVMDDIIKADSGFKSFLYSQDLCRGICA